MEYERIKYPIGEQDFANIREENKVYIDKTGYIYQLLQGPKYNFLARPRRFGKSLLLSTIKYFFEGRKDLFQGLQINNLQNEWKPHPVFHLSWELFNPHDPHSIDNVLEVTIGNWEKVWNISNSNLNYAGRLVNLIQHSVKITGRKAVFLVDEYDSPLLATLFDEDYHTRIKSTLRSIYSIIKNQDEFLRFGMLTGVARFSKMEFFSGLNNINDITLLPKYSAICGVTENELKTVLLTSVDILGQKLGKDRENVFLLLKNKYDGYHFSENSEDIYNPYSLLNTFENNRLSNYWFASGTPGFLIERIYENLDEIETIMNSEVSEVTLSETDTAYTSPIALLFQAGYLTIKEFDPQYNEYKLGIPNQEVSEGFYRDLMARCLDRKKELTDSILISISKSLRNGDPEGFIKQLQRFFGDISYEISGRFPESYYQSYVYILCQMIGIYAEVERRISSGRIDLLIRNSNYVYIVEFKVDVPAEDALRQINDKDYAIPWSGGNRKVFKIGISFSSVKRNIENYIIEE